jgi:hypothetical protein
MLSRQIEEAERKEVLDNDRRVRQEQSEKRRALREDRPSTYADHYIQEETGRFAQHGAAYLVGSEPIPKYPELPVSSPFHHDPVPDEPPLSPYDNPAFVGLDHPSHQDQDQLGEPRAPTVPSDVQLGSPPLSQSDDDLVGLAGGEPPASRTAGSSSPKRNYRRLR